MLSDKFQSDRDKGNKSASAEVMRTYFDQPQGIEIHDQNTADSRAAARVQTLCPQRFTLKMVDALRLNAIVPSWLQSVCVNNCMAAVRRLQ